MFRKWIKMIGAAALACMLFFALGVPAFAAEATVDWGKTGSVCVTPRSVEGEHPVIGGSTYTLYRVAQASAQGNNIAYTLTEAFAGSKADLTDLNTAGLAKTLAEYAAAQKLTGTVRSADAAGAVRFENLELGLYLLVQTGTSKGSYATDPFLVSVPMTSEDGTAWVYDVEASPKAAVYALTDVAVRKVWNDGSAVSSRPESITVELYDDGTLVDTAKITAANGWTHTWREMKKGDSYSVKELEVQGYTASYTQDGDTFTITNTSTAALVQTGQLNWPIPLLAGCGVALFAAGWALVNLKKKKG